MTFESILAIVLIALIVGGALTYVILAKRRGQKCIGCPYAKSCGGSCHSHDERHIKEPKQDQK